MTEPHNTPQSGPDQSTPTAATDGAPAKAHGDPLLAASEGATEGTEGSRQGVDSDALEQRET